MVENYRQSKKTGLPPGSLVHIGRKTTEKALFYWLIFNENNVSHGSTTAVEDIPKPGASEIIWIDMVGINHIGKVDALGKMYKLHPLVLEDIVNTEQRPKFEEFGDYTFFTLKKADYPRMSAHVSLSQVSIVFSENFIISFREENFDSFDDIRKRILAGTSRARKKKPDFLVYLVIDSIVDGYFDIIEKLSDEIEIVEEKMIKDIDGKSMPYFQRLRRNLSLMLKSLYPMREALAKLEKHDNSFLNKENVPYFRDVYDHSIHIIESIENQKDILGGVLDVYLSSLNNKMNSIMKVLTFIATIFIPISFIASVYGMNFDRFPELHWEYGYMYFWILIVVIVLLMLLFFKKRKWL